MQKLSGYINCFLCRYVIIPNRNNFREEGFILVHGSSDKVPYVQEWLVTGSIPAGA